jgi:hypothetical protein
MEHVASQVVHDLYLGSEMRPRRWYSDEIGPPPRRNVTLDRRTWRYRALIRHKNEDAAPIVGAASKFFRPARSSLPFSRENDNT